jgi:hypothetical protein
MNFVPKLFFFLFKRTKLMCKNELFKSLETKNKLHAKFKDENNSLPTFKVLLFLIISCNEQYHTNLLKYFKY